MRKLQNTWINIRTKQVTLNLYRFPPRAFFPATTFSTRSLAIENPHLAIDKQEESDSTWLLVENMKPLFQLHIAIFQLGTMRI